uniref:non-specific serine/threonine protein kinase n=1 Tax=Salix viminalis TaxID=40686 RepID=A0A6N2LKH5_SALVM
MTSLLHKPFFSIFLHVLFFHILNSPSFLAFADQTSSVTSVFGNNTEAEALSKWKASLDNQSQSLLSSWVGTSPCQNWVGITCDNSGSVSNLTLQGFGLRGTLHDFNFQSFPNLLILNLAKNSFYGSIPPHISNLSKIIIFDLCYNDFTGGIPPEIGLLKNLILLRLCVNHFSGSIPHEIGKLTSLSILVLSANNLSGLIPQEVGLLVSLKDLELSMNSLTGEIPYSIGNLSNLSNLFLSGNKLSGSIPQEIYLLESLKLLDLSFNVLTGTIRDCLGNLTNLTYLALALNQLSGPIPPSIGQLKSLVRLVLTGNKFHGSLPLEMNNLTRLTLLALSTNEFTGPLPQDINPEDPSSSPPIPSQSRTSLASEPPHHMNTFYPSLDYVDLSYNNFHGELSSRWGECRNMTSLKISNNNVSGEIPPKLGKATRLHLIDLSSNQLQGTIPNELGRLKLLYKVTLNNNHLSGTIPEDIRMLSSLQVLDLASNNLSGSIPKQLGECSNLLLLNLSSNKFTESIPSEIGSLQYLQDLDISCNFLAQGIPWQLAQLRMLETLDISHNMLSGVIPSSFKDLLSLSSVDISFNELRGPIPDIKAFHNASYEALRDNMGLCGNASGLKLCNLTEGSRTSKKKGNRVVILIVLPILGSLLLVFVVVGAFFILCQRARKSEAKPGNEQDRNMFTILGHDGKKLYENIIEATEEFNSNYCIGEGGYGTVYKAVIPMERVVAVKKLHQSQTDKLSDFKAFEKEVCVLANIRHRNIVKLYGFCSHAKHSFLVYEFVERGSLRKVITGEEQAIELDWMKRLNVVKGMVGALSYLHHSCSPPIIHRDITSNNVLLDLEYEAHVSDFGTARLLMPDSSNWTVFAGTFGYSAPGA